MWFYVSGRGFVALAQATGAAEPFAPGEKPPWPDDRGYAARLPLRFVADLKEPIRPAFPPGFGGYKRDPALGIGSNQLLTGFFRLDPEQHVALVERSGGDVRGDYPPPTAAGPGTPPARSADDPAAPTIEPPSGPLREPLVVDQAVEPPEADSLHTRAQWQLARLGSALGLDVWIPRADRNRSYRGARLGDLSVANLPAHGLPVQARAIVENIDVLWIDAGVVVCAFEVEHSATVYSGLLRLSDLITVMPYTSIRLFIVASAERRDKVDRELVRPTFAKARPPLSQACRFLSYERLAEHLAFAEEHGRYLKFDWVDRLAEPSPADAGGRG